MHACAVCAQKRKEANEFYKNELKKKRDVGERKLY